MLFRFVLLAVLSTMIARAFWRVVDAFVEGLGGRQGGTSSHAPSVSMSRDPVCGTFVVPERAVSIADGRSRVYFCSEACRDTFRAKSA
jgi:YHS domain-containing protein